jgi:hypothetical protein
MAQTQLDSPRDGIRPFEDAGPEPAHNIFQHLETNIQSKKQLRQVNLETHENLQRENTNAVPTGIVC